MSISLATVLFISSLFAVSIQITAICSDCDDVSRATGFDVLVHGWLGIFHLTVAWFANPFLLLGMAHLHRRPRTALVLSSVGLGLALSSLAFKKMWIGQKYAIYASVDYKLGFYLWLGSFCVLWCGAILKLIRNRILRGMGEDV